MLYPSGLKFYFLPWRFRNFRLYPLVFEISHALHILKFFTMPSLFRFYVCSIFFLCPFFSFFSLLLLSLFHFSCESWQKRWFVFLFSLLTLSVSFPSPSPSLWIFYFSSFLLSSSLCLLIFWFSLLYASRVLFPRFVAVHGRPSDVVVKIFGHKRKPEGGKRIGAVQRRHIKGIGRLT